MSMESRQFGKLGEIEGVFKWSMPVHGDERGQLMKAYVAEKEGSFPTLFKTYEHFFTKSKKDVFRGLHFQNSPHAVTKVISLVSGSAEIYLFDSRKNSISHGVIHKVTVLEESPISIYIPIGVALGYLILEDETIVSYQMDGKFCGNCDAGIDPSIVSSYMSLPLARTIRSARDLALKAYNGSIPDSICLSK